MKFNLVYCLSLDDKLSIYDVRDLNFDETMEFDSAKEQFQCPNDACRLAFDAANVLGTFNAKNVNYVRTPHFKNMPSTRHVADCPYVSLKTPASGLEADGAESDDGREEHFPSELLLTRREYVRKPASPKQWRRMFCAMPRLSLQRAVTSSSQAGSRRRTRPVSSPTRWSVLCRTSRTRSCSSACR